MKTLTPLRHTFRISYRIGRDLAARQIHAETVEQAIVILQASERDPISSIVRVSEQCRAETRATIAGMGGKPCQRFTNDESGLCFAHQPK